MKEYKPFPVSPIALIVPEMTASDFAEHKESIRRSGGAREKCVLIEDADGGEPWDGGEPGKLYKMLDGRHRERAQIELGIKPEYRAFGSHKKDGDSPTRFVVDMNLERRHLMTSQKIAAATNSLPHYQKEAEARKKAGVKAPEGTTGRAIDTAAAAAGVSPTSVAVAAAVKEADPAAFAEIEAGTTTVNAAAIATGVIEKPKAKSKKIAEQKAAAAGTEQQTTETTTPPQTDIPQYTEADAGITTQVVTTTKTTKATPPTAEDEEERAALVKQHRGVIIVCGQDFVTAVENGTILKDREELEAFASISSGEMLKIQELIIRQWTVKKALAFLRDEVKRPEVSNLILRALIHNNRFECVVDGWKISIEKDKSPAK